MGFEMKLIGYSDFTSAMQRIWQSVTPPNLVPCLKEGATVILHRIQENVLEQELYEDGHLYDSIKLKPLNQYQIDVLVDCEYGAVHEFGYTGHITEKQRNFFWAKYIETGDDMWKALALSTDYTIPARPYVRPAIDESGREAWMGVAKELTRRLLAAAG